ncbi:MAG: type II toxin-antitoxin system Phd/YefM family antitoxin [Anaerolineales bacterium]
MRTSKVTHLKSVGIRALSMGASRILRRVRERGESVDITYRGQVVARLVPAISPPATSASLEAIQAELDLVAGKIGQRWPKTVSAAEAVSEGRR